MKNQSIRNLLFAGVLVALPGCSSSGVYVSEEQISQYQRGETHISDVIQELGQPTTRSVNDKGETTIMYIYSEATVRPETFIPYVGGLVGGTDSRSNAVSLIFNQEGVMQSYSSSGTQMGTATGLSAGVKNQRVKQHVREADESPVEGRTN